MTIRAISKRPLRWYLDRHHELWQWLVENPSMEKREWPGWRRFKRVYWEFCFACQMLIDYGHTTRQETGLCCQECLFDWGKDCNNCEAGIFSEWECLNGNGSPDERSILANHIKYMPIRECYQKELGKNECP